eukprot:Filipodium_phascolosomae@DN7921_c0_g1_i1.p1
MNSLSPATHFVVLIIERCMLPPYETFKRIACRKGIPSQVMTVNSLINQRGARRGEVNRPAITKLVLQILAKLGTKLWHISQIVSILEPVYKDDSGMSPYMVIGMDASLRQLKQAMFVSLVGTTNETLTAFSSTFKWVPAKEALEERLVEAFCCLIYEFNAASDKKVWPRHFIVYRDGLTDAQAAISLKTEITALQQACQKFEIRNPTICWTVVCKNTSAKFVYDKTPDGNVLPGTVICDATVTLRDRWEYYMVNQVVTVGTANAVKYIIVHDTSGIAAAAHQRLTNLLSFMYWNWTASIKVPHVLMLAHKLAQLVVILNPKHSSDINTEKLGNRPWYL